MSQIAPLLLPWFERHGRNNLPWQQQRDAAGYRVWLSEIMLQQTQVSTVAPYFRRFLSAFPDFHALADASLDQVLSLWAGLGYYARARNLHRCAGIVVEQYGGELPRDLDALMALPGIGRSTAGAILSLAFDQPAAILDGNVKRVLSRVYRVPGWPGKAATLNALWRLAQQQTPVKQAKAYNQAMMDLGATRCVRTHPDCAACPLVPICQSHQTGEQALYPQRKPAAKRVHKHTWMLLHRHRDRLLLERRPEQGIWGGLWSLPEVDDLNRLADWQRDRFGLHADAENVSENLLRHQFTHFELSISLAEIPVTAAFVRTVEERVCDTCGLAWVPARQLEDLGLPVPVARLLENLT